MYEDRRLAPRTELRAHATLTLARAKPVAVQTLDVAPGGLCIVIGNELSVGKSCRVNFPISLKKKKYKVAADAIVMYSIRRENGDFKVGLQFVDIDPAGAEAIEEYLAFNEADIFPAIRRKPGPVLVSSHK